jgi:thymidylate kinase
MEDLLNTIFSQLSIRNLDYCILRNYQGLPHDVGNDVDMFIPKQQIKEFETVLNECLADSNWIWIKSVHRFCFHSYYIAELIPTSTILKIDVWGSINWRSFSTASSQVILDTKQNFNGFWVVSSGTEAGISIFKEYLQFGKVKDKGDGIHKEHFNQLVKDDPENFLATVALDIGEDWARFALECVQQRDWEKLESKVNSIRRHLILNHFIRNPFQQIGVLILFTWGHIYDKFIFQPGLFICLIGPDGSGKTTISSGINRDFTSILQPTNKFHYYHGHFGILPELKSFYNIVARWLKRKPKSIPNQVEGLPRDKVKPYSLPSALLSVLYYTVDYWCGNFLVWRLKSKGDIILFDRYFYDYLMSDVYQHVPRWLLWTLFRFVPQPDIVIYPYNDPQIIHDRKPELTVDEIAKQAEICQQIIDKHPNPIVIKTENNSILTLAEITAEILKFMNAKIARNQPNHLL